MLRVFFAIDSELKILGDLESIVLALWATPGDALALIDHSLDDDLLVRIRRKAKAL